LIKIIHMEKKGKVYITVLDFFTGIPSFIFSIGGTIVSGIGSSTSTSNTAWITALCVFASLIFVQILAQQYLIRVNLAESKESLDELVRKGSSIIFPKNNSKVDDSITEKLSSGGGKSIKIICFGTSLYGQMIKSVRTNFPEVKIEAIICSPTSIMLHYQDDIETLKSSIEYLKEKKVEFHESKIPPTIRASIVYDDKEKPILCAIQPYFIFPSSRQFQGDTLTPTFFASEDNPVILKELSRIFELEFKRLKESGVDDDKHKKLIKKFEDSNVNSFKIFFNDTTGAYTHIFEAVKHNIKSLRIYAPSTAIIQPQFLSNPKLQIDECTIMLKKLPPTDKLFLESHTKEVAVLIDRWKEMLTNGRIKKLTILSYERHSKFVEFVEKGNKQKTPADNERFHASGGVCPQTVFWEFGSLSPARTFVEPPPA